MRSEALTEVTVSTVVREMAPCSLAGRYQLFGGTCFHSSGWLASVHSTEMLVTVLLDTFPSAAIF
jgi:hypothetical protein